MLAGGRHGPVMQDLPRHDRGVWVFSMQGEAMEGFKQEATRSMFSKLSEKNGWRGEVRNGNREAVTWQLVQSRCKRHGPGDHSGD